MITFAYNPTSWDDGPIPGGMADRLVQPVLPHLRHQALIESAPAPGAVNVYYTFRGLYGGVRPAGELSVFASHGIADKGWRPGHKVADQFDIDLVSGPLYAEMAIATGMPAHRVFVVGYPKLDPLIGRERSKSPDGRIRVLWAPTHGGGGEHDRRRSSGRSSWGSLASLAGDLDEAMFDVIVAPHPRHRQDRRATFDEYLEADVVIADGGSTMYEAWALGLPVVFPTWMTGAGHASALTLEADIYRRRVGRHAQIPGVLPDLLFEAAVEGITAAEEEFVEPILPAELRGCSGRLHAEVLDELADRHGVGQEVAQHG